LTATLVAEQSFLALSPNVLRQASCLSSSRIVGCRRLRRLLLFFGSVMADRAACRGSGYTVLSCYVPGSPTDGRAFQTAFRLRLSCRGSERHEYRDGK
jgi:hypothetical protein